MVRLEFQDGRSVELRGWDKPLAALDSLSYLVKRSPSDTKRVACDRESRMLMDIEAMRDPNTIVTLHEDGDEIKAKFRSVPIELVD